MEEISDLDWLLEQIRLVASGMKHNGSTCPHRYPMHPAGCRRCVLEQLGGSYEDSRRVPGYDSFEIGE